MKHPDEPSIIATPTEEELERYGGVSPNRLRECPSEKMFGGQRSSADIPSMIRIGPFVINSTLSDGEDCGPMEIRDDELASLEDGILIEAQESSENFVQADTNLYRTGWNLGMVHGSVALQAVIKLCSELLEEGENVDRINKLRFNDPIFNNLTLQVYVGSTRERPSQWRNNKKPLMVASLETSNGRTINVQGFDNDSTIGDRIESANSIANLAVCTDSNNTEVVGSDDGRIKYSMPLHELDGASNYLQANPQHTLTTALDTIGVGLTNIRDNHSALPRYGGLIGCVRDLRLPSGSIFDGEHRLNIIVPDYSKIKPKENGQLLFPVDTSFVGDDGASVGDSVFYMSGMEDPDQYMAYYEKELIEMGRRARIGYYNAFKMEAGCPVKKRAELDFINRVHVDQGGESLQ